MFERYTNDARRLVVLAQEAARERHHNYIGTEHLLIATVRVIRIWATEQTPAGPAYLLQHRGVDGNEIIRLVDEIIMTATPSPVDGHIPFTPRSKKVLELSLREALGAGHDHIGPEHVFVALQAEGEGVGAQILARFGFSLEESRDTLLGVKRWRSYVADAGLPSERIAAAEALSAGAPRQSSRVARLKNLVGLDE